MTLLHTLRNTPWLARLALLWFAMTLGVAVASPMVNPQSEVMICSAANGMVKVVLNADGSLSTASATMDCPLCMVGGAPASVLQHTVQAPYPLTHVLRSPPESIFAARTAAPLPPRGPPTLGLQLN